MACGCVSCSPTYSIGSDDGGTDALVPSAEDDAAIDNQAGLPDSEIDDLVQGGPLNGMKLLYPYDGTVFPRGTLPPLAMWNGDPATDVAYLHLKSRSFEYRGILRPNIASGTWLPFGLKDEWPAQALGAITGQASTQLPIPAHAWQAAAEATQGASDPFTLELTARVNGRVEGPVTMQFVIAQATLHVSVYYNSCLSDAESGSALDWLADPFASLETIAQLGRSKIMRVRPGGEAENVLSDSQQARGCYGCHSVSADGARLLVQGNGLADESPSGSADDESMSQGLAFDLRTDGKAEDQAQAAGQNASYGALYPDGSKYLSSSGLGGGVGYSIVFGNPLGVLQSLPATLYDTTTGAPVEGTGIPEGAAMPMFSPDGRQLVFNDAARAGGRGLSLMDYDPGNDKASARRELVEEEPDSALRPGWPFFLPDRKAVVFVRTDSPDFSSGAGAQAFIGDSTLADLILAPPYSSDLYLADITSGQTLLLAKAMGFATAEDAKQARTYLPSGAQDLHHNYFPSVSPVAAGGYFWVFFDTLRDYGNLGRQRAIWVFALDIQADGSYTRDPSHPPFYLPGQSYKSDNHRPFAARERGREDGEACASGLDCAGGRCRNGTCARAATGATSRDCARVEEACASHADCCPPEPASAAQISCIAGFCASVPDAR